MNIKKIIKIASIVIASIFLILLVTPFLFKGKLMEIAKRELNNMLTAEVEFSDLKLSFIRNFPNAYIALEDLAVTGKGDFEGEILAAFKRFSVTVDIVSIIKMDNIQVKSILLDKPELNAIILEDGRANWDIMKNTGADTQPAAETAPAEADAQEAFESPFKITLKKFEIRNAVLSFRDESSGMKASVNDLNLLLRGDMAKEIVDLVLNLDIKGINFWLDGIRLLNDAQVGFNSEIAADLKNMGFTLKDNQFNLNEIILKFSGFIGMPGDDINIDLDFATEKTDFKSLLSLVPVIYMQDFVSLETKGSLTLSGGIKGTLNDKQMPCANVDLTVDNAMFKYPALPKSVDDINIAINAYYDGVVFDNTTLDIDKFDFKIAGNPFGAGLHVKTPESDMHVAAKFAGKIDFNSMKDIVPLDDIKLGGLLECDLTVAGNMSTLEKGQYEKFSADGMLKISGFDFESPDFPQAVKITITHLIFNPRRVELAAFDAVIGSSDLSLNGSLENFIPFIFKGDTVRGNLSLKSNNINLNEIMSGDKSETPEKPETEAAALSVVEVPKNIDFTMNANIGKIIFDKLNITNTNGLILVKDGKVDMRNLSMNLLEGSMVLNGEYNTQDMKAPSVNLGMDIKQFDITSALSSFELLEKILPNPQDYTGKVSANLTLKSVLGEDFSPVTDSINSKGRFQTHNLTIKNSKLFGTLADLTKNESFRTPAPGNLNVGFEIKDGRLIIDPFNINIAQTKLEISGDQGLDTSLNYKVKASVPVATIGQGATDLLSKIPGGSNVKDLTLTGFITGEPASPNVSLSVTDMAGSIGDAVKTQVSETVREEVEKQIASMMAEAEKQRDNIIKNAKDAADKIRSETNARAEKMEEEAESKSNLEKRLALAAAEKLRSEGEASARNLERDAEKQANAVMETARQRADELRRAN